MSEALLDPARLSALFGGKEAEPGFLVDLFIEQSRTAIAELGQGVADRDKDTVRLLAHRLKGSASVVGAVRLSRLADLLHQIAVAGRLDAADRLLAELPRALEATAEALARAGHAASAPPPARP